MKKKYILLFLGIIYYVGSSYLYAEHIYQCPKQFQPKLIEDGLTFQGEMAIYPYAALYDNVSGKPFLTCYYENSQNINAHLQYIISSEPLNTTVHANLRTYPLLTTVNIITLQTNAFYTAQLPKRQPSSFNEMTPVSCQRKSLS